APPASYRERDEPGVNMLQERERLVAISEEDVVLERRVIDFARCERSLGLLEDRPDTSEIVVRMNGEAVVFDRMREQDTRIGKDRNVGCEQYKESAEAVSGDP